MYGSGLNHNCPIDLLKMTIMRDSNFVLWLISKIEQSAPVVPTKKSYMKSVGGENCLPRNDLSKIDGFLRRRKFGQKVTLWPK